MNINQRQPFYTCYNISTVYIFESSQSHGVGEDCSVSNSPLCVAWLVVIADPNLGHSWNGNTL